MSQPSRRVQFVDGLRRLLRPEAEFYLALEPFKLRALFMWIDPPSIASCFPFKPELLLCKLELLDSNFLWIMSFFNQSVCSIESSC